MTVGLVLTAFGLGLRHGVDWDHIAAIADLSSTATTRRRGLVLSTLYALGHAVVVLLLGLIAIGFGSALPSGVDAWMGRVVGATLVAMGAWVLLELVRKGRDFRLRSRWILVFGGTFAGVRRVREARARRRLRIEHEHAHVHTTGDHAELDEDDLVRDHSHDPAHDHPHGPDTAKITFPEVPVGAGSRRRFLSSNPSFNSSPNSSPSSIHSHAHAHETALVEGVDGTGNGAAAGIGLLHGIGFESPTQIAVFVASTSLGGVWAGLSLLVAWVIGLVVANAGLSVLAAFGLLGADRNFTIYAGIAIFVAAASLAMGTFLLLGIDPPLPAL